MSVNFIPFESKSGFRSRGFSVDPTGNLTVKSLTIRNIDDPDASDDSVIIVDNIIVKGVQLIEGGDSTLIALGDNITASALTRLGTLEYLNIDGDLRISEGSTPYFNVVDGHIEMTSVQSIGIIENFNIGVDLPGTGNFTSVTVSAATAANLTITYTVTIAGPQGSDTGNKYILNGVYRPTLNLVSGNTYVFNQDDDTNVYWPNANGTTVNRHALNFSADDISGERGNGTSYLTNVEYRLNGAVVTQAAYVDSAFDTATSRQVRITVTNSTPTVLYYWCYNHVLMGNLITVSTSGSLISTGNLTVLGASTLTQLAVTGNASVSLPPTNIAHVTRKDYVDARVSAFAIAFGA